MNIKLQHQKMQLQIALNYLSLVEVCEENINKGIDVANYVLRKNEYAKMYAEVMATIVGEAIEISKVDFENEEQC